MIVLWIGIFITLILFMVGSPIYAALGIGAAMMSLWAFGLPPATVGQMMVAGANSYTLLAIPLYILMGEIFLRGGSSKYLVNFIQLVIGRIRGGMGIAAVLVAGFFAAISASGSASIATVGMIMIPEMKKANYPRGFAGAIVASSGTLGNLIPPSLFFIMYGALCELNIATLFAAGVIPGILAVLGLSITTSLMAMKGKFELSPKTTWKEKVQTTRKAVPAILMPIFVLGSIYTGMATPTEAGSVAVVYSLLLGFFVYRSMDLNMGWQAVRGAVLTSGAIMVMVAAGILLSRMFVLAGFPEAITEFVMRSKMSTLTYMLLSGVIIMILGTFIETVLMIYICVPLFYPTAMALGVDPIHWGVCLVAGVIAGETTPPMAESIFIASSASGVPTGEIMKYMFPFMVCLTLLYFILIVFPELSLALPRMMGMKLG
jgi:C4-dicarboxylate transporter DctM subunit